MFIYLFLIDLFIIIFILFSAYLSCFLSLFFFLKGFYNLKKGQCMTQSGSYHPFFLQHNSWKACAVKVNKWLTVYMFQDKIASWTWYTCGGRSRRTNHEILRSCLTTKAWHPKLEVIFQFPDIYYYCYRTHNILITLLCVTLPIMVAINISSLGNQTLRIVNYNFSLGNTWGKKISEIIQCILKCINDMVVIKYTFPKLFKITLFCENESRVSFWTK